jgi:hypothetical protein
MDKYLFFIIIGILLFLFINIESFSIGGTCCTEAVGNTCSNNDDCSGGRTCTSTNVCGGYSYCTASEQLINCQNDDQDDQDDPDDDFVPLIDTKIDILNDIIYNGVSSYSTNIILTFFACMSTLITCDSYSDWSDNIVDGNIYHTNFFSSQLAKSLTYISVFLGAVGAGMGEINYSVGALPLIASELIIFSNIMMSGAMNIYARTLDELNQQGTLTTLSGIASCTDNIGITGNFIEDTKKHILQVSFKMYQNIKSSGDPDGIIDRLNYEATFGIRGIFNSIDISVFQTTGLRFDINTISHIMKYMDLWETIYSFYGLDDGRDRLIDFERNINEFFPHNIDDAKRVLQSQFQYNEIEINTGLYETISIRLEKPNWRQIALRMIEETHFTDLGSLTWSNKMSTIAEVGSADEAKGILTEHFDYTEEEVYSRLYTTETIRSLKENWRDIAIQMAQANIERVTRSEASEFDRWFFTLGKKMTQYFLRDGVNMEIDTLNELFDDSTPNEQTFLLDFTKVTYNGWFSSANDMFDFYISLVRKTTQLSLMHEDIRMRTTYPLSKTIGVCAALTRHLPAVAVNKFVDVTLGSVGCIVTTVNTLLEDGYNRLYQGDTQNTELTEVLIQAPGMRVGTRRLDTDKQVINLTSFNSLNISKENINDILVIFDDDILKATIQNTTDDDFMALNDYDTNQRNSIDNIKVILFILLTSYDVKEFIYSDHNKGEDKFYIFKKLFESGILYSVLITYSV